MIKTAQEASTELVAYRKLLMEDASDSAMDTGCMLAKAIELFVELEQAEVNSFVIPDVSYCSCEHQKVIPTKHPLPDICEYCGGAIREL